MRSSWRWICPLLSVILWIPGTDVEANAAKAEADSLFQATMEMVGRVPVKEGLKAFERVLKTDWKYAPAHYEMAKLYMSLNTVMDRQRARSALHEALRLDPENVTYQLTLGDLLWAQGLWLEAREQYEKVLKAHPDNARAAYGIGYYALKDFMKYQNMTGDIGLNHFAEKDREKAIFYLERSIELNSVFRDAYYQLGVVYMESRQPVKLIGIADRLLKQYPGDKDALLFCALGYQTTGNQEKAYARYTEAIKQMGSEERTMMESVALIATKEEQKRIAQTSVQSQEEDSTRSWTDSAVRDGFWRRQDPLFLTPFNERRMEHYSRVAYANLCFSQPSREIEGWQTDMGKTYIKFGRPVQKIAERPRAEVPERPDLFMEVYPHLEMWFYEDFDIQFRSDGMGTWNFGGGFQVPPFNVSLEKNDEKTVSEYFRNIRSIPMSSIKPGAQEIFNRTPSRYVDPYKDKKYSLPHQVVIFQEGDSVRVELSYAIPKNRLKASGPEGMANLVDGIFVFDEGWKEVYRKPDTLVKLKWPTSDPQEGAGADSLRRNYLVSYSTVYVRPGPYHVAVEVLDQGTGSVGTFRDLRTFSFSDSVLSISDFLLASRIETRNSSPERREDLSITPNPLRTFHRSEAVSVYFEVYNLKLDRDGRTEYEVSYRVGRPEKKEVDPALFAALDLPEAQGRVEIERVVREEEDEPEGIFKRPGGPVEYRVRYVLPERNRISDQAERIERAGRGAEIAVTARYAGERRDDFAYLQIDMTWMPRGVYRLTVAVRDARSGRTAEREALFRVVE